MFNNFVNAQDFFDLIDKGPRLLPQLAARLAFGKRQRVKTAWAHTATPPTNWWDIPSVRARWNQLISGFAAVDYHKYISQKFFKDRDSLCALSLGCGTGHNELIWAALGQFGHIDAYDLSEQRIRTANEAAVSNGFGNIINYSVGDVFSIELREGHYDAILVEQSLHHFSPLDEILLRIERFLHTDGYFIVNEYVGPTRFQWTNRQLEAVNSLLSALPAKYRTLWGSDAVKQKATSPSRLHMLLSDPSEAVESESIMRLLRQTFELVEVKGYGGNILHLLFNGIAHNFLSDDAETRGHLDTIFKAEDALLNSGDMQSDFVVAVCRKR
jgi:ubiquinone/menaquinone biosynthesis C-methylase UbiE